MLYYVELHMQDPTLLFEFLSVMAVRLDAVARQPAQELSKPLPPTPKQAASGAVDFRASIRKLQNALVAIAR